MVLRHLMGFVVFIFSMVKVLWIGLYALIVSMQDPGSLSLWAQILGLYLYPGSLWALCIDGILGPASKHTHTHTLHSIVKILGLTMHSMVKIISLTMHSMVKIQWSRSSGSVLMH